MDKQKLSLTSSSGPKVSAFAKFKGRPSSLPVPSFSFRFNPTDDETLEELEDVVEDDKSATTTTKETSSPIARTFFANKKGSFPFGNSEESTPDGSETPSWSILSEIKGKIARTVEERFRIASTDRSNAALVRAKSDLYEKTKEREGNEEDKDVNSKSNEWSRSESVEVLEKDAENLCRNVESDVVVEPETELRNRLKGGGREAGSVSVERYEPVMERVDKTVLKSSSSLLSSFNASQKKTIVAVVAFLVYLFLPLPSYLNGFIVGFAIAFVLVTVWHTLLRPTNRLVGFESSRHSRYKTTESRYSTRSTLNVNLSSGIEKVWMNELLSDYDLEDFHINQTQSVLVRLDGSVLRLSYSKAKIPKRAMWNEPNFELCFVHQRHYDLTGAKVSLLPEGIARKRHWLRKYPISILLAEHSKVVDVGAPINLVKTREGSLTLFARSARDKEEWFRRFEYASKSKEADADNQNEKLFQEYSVYISRLISTPLKEASEKDDSDSVNSVTWLNAFLGRCLWDFLREKEWALRVRDKIQRKLSMIKVPYFVEELRVTDLQLGSELPQLCGIAMPKVDERGLWIDFEMSYYGTFHMTLETKLNLLKLKKEPSLEQGFDALVTESNSSTAKLPRNTSSLYDSEAEDSAESSSDEDYTDQASDPGNDDPMCPADAGRGQGGGGAAGKKILRLVDSITQSRYFQQAAEYKYVKKAMEGVSNTPLILTVEVLSLNGTLTVNVPPPPSDRLWYGFRGNPQLVLVAKPKVGERKVNLAHVVEWIENKLVLEFQRLLVLPNMDDVIIPIMNSGMGRTNSPEDDSLTAPIPETKENT